METKNIQQILVIGGAGYVGAALCPFLLEKGYDVDVIDLLWFGNHLPHHILVSKKDAFACTQGQLKKYECVIFLAGLSTDPMAEFHPALNYMYNAALPAYIAYIAKQAGVKRFIFASSCSVYGHAADRLYAEEDAVHTKHPYGIGKYQGEKGAMQVSNENFSVIVLRFGTISGNSPRMRMDLIVNTMFMNAISKKRIIVHNPSIWRPICHIHDALDAIICALQAPYSIGGVFNIASLNATVLHTAGIIKKKIWQLTGQDIRLEIIHKSDPRNYKVSCERAKSILGFSPYRGVEDIVDDLMRHRDEYGNFTNESYYNILVFKKLFAENASVLPNTQWNRKSQ